MHLQEGRMGNPRRANGSRRDALRARLRAQERPCWICRAFGRDGAIDYSLPAGHPMSFEADEIIPVSLGGDPLDPANVDAAHRRCNQWRGNRTVDEVLRIASGDTGAKRSRGKPLPVSRDWRERPEGVGASPPQAW